MTVSDADRADVIRLLNKDVAATLGPGYDVLIQQAVDSVIYTPDVTVLVDVVQQRFHDLRIDTTWPACPRHKRHPLGLSLRPEGLCWTCMRDEPTIIRFGELGSSGGGA